ncbi:cupin domain-containing protein [bacterium]|nr:cupin domain-containing protein [bacterium]
MTNFKNAEIGNLNELGKHYENGKAFLYDLLGLTSCEISVSSMPAGIKLPFYHKHKQNEEIYIFLKGNGTMTLDNEVIEVKEGSCVKVLPEAVRTMESKTDLQYICVQAKTNSLEQFGFGDAELC